MFSSFLPCHRSKRDSVYTDIPSYPGLPSPGQLGSNRSDQLDDGDDTTATNNDNLLCIRHYPNYFTNIASFNPSTTRCDTWLYNSCFAVIKGEVIKQFTISYIKFVLTYTTIAAALLSDYASYIKKYMQCVVNGIMCSGSLTGLVVVKRASSCMGSPRQNPDPIHLDK